MRSAVLLPLALLAFCAYARIDVRNHGAAGDGETDDFPTLQRILDKASRRVNADAEMHAGDERLRDRRDLRKQCFVAEEIYLPKGVYRISRALVCRNSLLLRGEEGAVIECSDPDGLALYLELAYRCHISGVTFRGGANHIAFWTKNRDSAMVIVEKCRFEDCSDVAIFSESWRKTEWTPDIPYEKRPRDMAGPYEVKRDNDGLPVLARTNYNVLSANSTLAVVRDCEFKECGAAYRGSMDGQSLSRLRFSSRKPQRLPVFSVSYVAELTDIAITANIPKGYSHGWFDGARAHLDLRRVRAVSTSGFGAPLYAVDIPPRREVVRWWNPQSVRLIDCVSSSANSPCGTLIDFRRREPALLYVTGCHEADGCEIGLMSIGEPPRNLEDMRQVNHSQHVAALSETHRWMLDGNGKEIVLNVPKILKPCLEKPLPAEAFAGFPETDRPLPDLPSKFGGMIRAEAFGIGSDPSMEDETARLQKILDAAAEEGDATVLLPGRTFRISDTLVLPRRVRIRADGRCVFHMPCDDKDVFRVRNGKERLAVVLDDIVFRRGRNAFTAEGEGSVQISRCVLVDGYGFKVRCETPLSLSVTIVDSVALIRRFLEGDGADMRVKDSWVEPFFEGDVPHTFICRRGQLLCERVLGVPLPGENAAHAPERRPSLSDGQYCYWILAEDSTVRTWDLRCGGEYGGAPLAELFGSSKLLAEGNKLFWNSPCGCGAAFYSHDRRTKVTFNYVSMVSYPEMGRVVGKGKRPSALYLGGCLNKTVSFDGN